MTADERLREALTEWLDDPWDYRREIDIELESIVELKELLAARGLAIVETGLPATEQDQQLTSEVSKGEPLAVRASPCSESVSRGDVPTGNEGRQAARLCSCTKHPTGCYGHPDTCGCRVAALEAALHDAIHELATRNGYIVTDKPEYAFAQSGPQALIVQPGLYWRDDTTEAVKRLQEVLDGDALATGQTAAI